MEKTSKSSDLLARLRSVTLEDELELSDFCPKDNSPLEMSDDTSYQSDRLSNFISSWNSPSTSVGSESFQKFESKSSILSDSVADFTASAERAADKTSVSSIFASKSVENQENPFAKISRKGSSLTSCLPKKLSGWLMNTSCFGILGVLCGGSLTAWSLLTSGSHSMTALGLSLTISGLLMLISVGIFQTVLHTSGQT